MTHSPKAFDINEGYFVSIDGHEFMVPYRQASRKLSLFAKDRYLRQLRDHDGHKREAALKDLIAQDLDARGAAYALVALADYVIEISSLPIKVTPRTKQELRQIVQENPQLVAYLEATCISYWNAYYRNRYTSYADYPAYAFLQALK